MTGALSLSVTCDLSFALGAPGSVWQDKPDKASSFDACRCMLLTIGHFDNLGATRKLAG
jgi:hypothetical protein